ncbi:uncharacterized protein TRAVEDRAFT_62373 [Trametes versicolor FP-101664 SS1]|uniref:uncharacterized protein n=1 Tax=Trametes versicolor (strain FP-101664) TaxID=717944 RepID=UPI00046242D2|nr:uncharacterized protein TRAVEDRAFT_62373 [Trametes versicolor FP-101664 SS1]EIW65079.1 hypothetical protein TRAVEDRAFT_62373 [Trametes versicolor FP-101664 SS1]
MSLASDPRASPFTVQEFSDLVCSAFNLEDADLSPPSRRPLLSFTPPSPHSLVLPDARVDLSGCCFEGETEDEHQDPRSPSLDDASPQSSPPGRRSRSRTITALRVFHQVRTRASAFVLRPRAPSVSRNSPPPLPFEPLPPLLAISPTLIPTPIIPRPHTPLSMLDLNLDHPGSRTRSRAESLPRSLLFKRETTPPPLPVRQSHPGTSAGVRDASFDLRSFFDDSPVKSKRAYSRPSTATSMSQASTIHPLSRMASSNSAHAVLSGEGLPSFFEDTGYQVAKPAAPHYSRPTTPAEGLGLRIHTRLPALRKSKSGGHGLFSRSHRKDGSKGLSEDTSARLGIEDSAFWSAHNDGRTPSPFTCPREVPPMPNALAPFVLDSPEDLEAPLPPSYVFERRGSAASNSTASTRSSSSLSSKISSIVGIAFPSKMRLHARSKLNLNIATGPDPVSAHSSPSTLGSLSSPTTPVSPTSTFPRSQPYVFPGYADPLSQDNSLSEIEEDALALGRVLTPEADPFAKADIAVPIEGTPRPPTPPVSRRASSQTSPATGLYRTPTWNEERVKVPGPTKRTRNSLPASPVSSASTFPSTCSIYGGRDSSPLAHTPPTPKHNGPPSAWSPYSTPAASSSSPSSSSAIASSPSRSPSSAAKSRRRVSPSSPPSPTMSAFPLPPRTLPLQFPPPRRALPSIPLPSPTAPPVPPKDSPLSRVARAHKSLPPSPHPLPPLAGSPASVRSHRETGATRWDDRHMTLLPLKTDIRDLFAEADARSGDRDHLEESFDLSSSSLGEPWNGLGCGSSIDLSSPSAMSSGWQIRPVARRRSVDSTSTITGSPASSALHDAGNSWEAESSTTEGRPPVLEADTHPVSIPTDNDSDYCGSAVSLATFYTARSSLGSDSPAHTSPVVDFAMDARS